MKATVTAVALSILAGFVSLSASDSPVLGKWNCVSVNNETGTKLAWTLNVREDADKLSASVVVAETGDEIPALDPKAEGNTFSFKLRMNARETVEVTTMIEGKQLTGKFKGKDSGTGTVKGLRAE